MPFSEWMRRALYDPAGGYYARHIRSLGRRGDFSTAPVVCDVMGRAVARWIAVELARCKSLRSVIEIGGGDGSLMRAVRRALGFFRRRGLEFFMVESSPRLRERQQQALKGSGIVWFGELPAALRECGGRALIFHHELLDAFPVTLLEWDGTRWNEIWLVQEHGIWKEEKRALPPDGPAGRDFSALEHPPAATPQRVELGTSAREWMREWAPHWRSGSMLTLDYGAEFPGLYERRPRGTLRSYLFHQRIAGAAVYDNMGRQDITADVNFTDLMRWGETLGWENASLQSQRGFLRQHAPRFDQQSSRDPAWRHLADEHGAGTAFRALVQRLKP